MRTTITIQAKRSDEPETAWKTRNALRELNAALSGNKRTEQQAIDEATKTLNAWHNNYPQMDIMLRVHVERKR